MTYFTFLPHTLALLMTSQTLTARHKMAALTAVFSRLSNVYFNRSDYNRLKSCWESILIPFLSIELVTLLRLGTPLFSFHPALTVMAKAAVCPMLAFRRLICICRSISELTEPLLVVHRGLHLESSSRFEICGLRQSIHWQWWSSVAWTVLALLLRRLRHFHVVILLTAYPIYDVRVTVCYILCGYVVTCS